MIDRIKRFIELQNETASSFANEIGVQRSSVSHVLSGRNKPSLDFVMKVKDRYPDVSLEWLVYGKGGIFYNQEKIETRSKVNLTEKHNEDKAKDIERPSIKNPEEKPKSNVRGNEKGLINLSSNDKKINKIILLFEDNSFEEFIPNT